MNVNLNVQLNGHDDAKAFKYTPEYAAQFLTTLAFHTQKYPYHRGTSATLRSRIGSGNETSSARGVPVRQHWAPLGSVLLWTIAGPACVRSTVFAMAEGGVDPLSESFRKLDEELTCPVCHDHFEEPKVLPCLHYYCKKCIANLIGGNSRDRNDRFNCPECRRVVQLPANAPERYRCQSVANSFLSLP